MTEPDNLPEINKRIKLLINKYSDGNVANFVRLTGISSHQVLNRIFSIDQRSGKYPRPSASILTPIQTSIKGLNSAWLLNGNGNMLIDDTSPSDKLSKTPFWEIDNSSKITRKDYLKIINFLVDRESELLEIPQFQKFCDSIFLSRKMGKLENELEKMQQLIKNKAKQK